MSNLQSLQTFRNDPANQESIKFHGSAEEAYLAYLDGESNNEEDAFEGFDPTGQGSQD